MARVVVAGSINMDLVASVARLPHPGETLIGGELRYVPGGKGTNQAVAASRCGAAVLMIGRTGDDAFGATLRRFLADEGVDLARAQPSPTAATGTAIVLVDTEGQNAIVVSSGANADVTPDDVTGIALAPGDVLLSQNEIGADAIEALFDRGRAVGATTVFNAAPAVAGREHLLALADIVIVNESEDVALGLTGAYPDSGQVIVVTRGSNGVLAGDLHLPGHEVTAVDTTGAGDCFAGALAARLAEGAAVPDALRFANAAAALAVQRHGAAPSMPRRHEVDQMLR